MGSLKAKQKIMDLLARRDHSEKELFDKLSIHFSSEESREAIEYAKVNNWLCDPQVLAQRTAEILDRRHKGKNYIQRYLQKKGLPKVESNSELELEKALSLVKNKWSNGQSLSRNEKEKIGRFLISRGFENSIVRKVIYEKL